MTTVGKKPNGKLCSYQLGKNEVNNNSYFCFTRGNFQLKAITMNLGWEKRKQFSGMHLLKAGAFFNNASKIAKRVLSAGYLPALALPAALFTCNAAAAFCSLYHTGKKWKVIPREPSSPGQPELYIQDLVQRVKPAMLMVLPDND